jgi:hypothetical protein
MSFEIETLAQFFGPADDRKLPSLTQANALKAAKGLPAAMRGDAAEALVQTGRTLLNSPFVDILAEAWQTRRDIRRYRDAKQYPADQIHEYALVGHDISLKRTPKVELLVNGAPSGVIVEFELKLALDISAAHLKIQNARIIGARVGEFQGKGSFTCATVSLFERKSATFRLPGAVTLANPILIH